jgi:hypothetical protein
VKPKGGGVGIGWSMGLFYCLILSEVETQEGQDINQYMKIKINIIFIEKRSTVIV